LTFKSSLLLNSTCIQQLNNCVLCSEILNPFFICQIAGQSLMAPGGPPDTQTLLQHQQVIAQTHPEGSFFLTPEGTYVQLVNGVLRTVDWAAQVHRIIHIDSVLYVQ
jgi:hypothetical protein